MESDEKTTETKSETLEEEKDRKISECLKRHGVFFAFSDKQFDEKKREGITYVSLGAGTVCPRENAKPFTREYSATVEEYQKKRLKETGKSKLILDELRNHEAFYTWEIEDTFDAVKGYGITRDEVQAVFNAECQKEENHA